MSRHEYTAAIFEISNDLFIGAILEVGGAASFANSEEELILRLKDAANCIHESNKIDSKDMFDIDGLLSNAKYKEELIPCSL